ncbi:caspase family protein [Pseudorhodobacter sp.]|uniref:caspase family protein n=1 Tax=Pseudorhodobacter sp. TaxID=1934400 RepID=UPI002648FEB1|nr:caspase family protein [Pseudorhodobacter sp.]MDN5787482.1 caspase family protein [Pseudorhodobacter sp.]
MRAVSIVLFVALGNGSAAAADQGKLALVVGNQAYQHLPRLANPGNDARGVADALRRLGFEVTLLTDVNTDVFNVVLQAFAAQAKDAKSVVFYYSGHAFQMDGQNQLVPVAANPDVNGDVTGQTWQLDDIISQLQSANAQTLIFLDACRTSPIAGRAGRSDGLAQMQTRAGTFISFATRPGAVSFDRGSTTGNSPYTAALLNHMEQQGLSISDLMIKVRNDVEAATGGQQTPWDQSSLRAQFFFKPGPASAPLPVFETVQSDTSISPPPGTATTAAPDQAAPDLTSPEQVAALEPPKPGPVIQRVEAQDQSKIEGGAETRSAPKAVTAPVLAPVVAAPVPALQLLPDDLASVMQTELKRVGCYSMPVDGDWGNGSRSALSTYLEKAGLEVGAELEPTAEYYHSLLKAPEGVCPPVVARATPQRSRNKPVVRRQETTRRSAAPKAAAAAPAPAPHKTKCTFLVVAIVCK